MVNAHLKSSPTVIEFLLEEAASQIIHVYINVKNIPIHLVAMII